MSTEDVEMLMSITGSGDRVTAKAMLEAFGGDLNSAVEAVLSGQGAPASLPAAPDPPLNRRAAANGIVVRFVPC